MAEVRWNGWVSVEMYGLGFQAQPPRLFRRYAEGGLTVTGSLGVVMS